VESVAPTAGDPLHSLLASLGEPSLCSLLGAADSQVGSLASLGKTEVCLTLSPGPGAQPSLALHTSSDSDQLWLKTKHLLLAILPAVKLEDNSKSLIGALKSRTSSAQEQTYCEILDRRDIAGNQAVQTDKLDLTNVTTRAAYRWRMQSDLS